MLITKGLFGVTCRGESEKWSDPPCPWNRSHVTRSPIQEYQWPHKRKLCHLIYFCINSQRSLLEVQNKLDLLPCSFTNLSWRKCKWSNMNEPLTQTCRWWQRSTWLNSITWLIWLVETPGMSQYSDLLILARTWFGINSLLSYVKAHTRVIETF